MFNPYEQPQRHALAHNFRSLAARPSLCSNLYCPCGAFGRARADRRRRAVRRFFVVEGSTDEDGHLDDVSGDGALRCDALRCVELQMRLSSVPHCARADVTWRVWTDLCCTDSFDTVEQVKECAPQREAAHEQNGGTADPTFACNFSSSGIFTTT